MLKEQVWEDLDQFLLSPFYKKDGTALQILCTCIDSGYQSNAVCSFAKERTYMGIPTATAALKTLRTNVIAGGLMPSPQIDGEFLRMTNEQVEELQAQILREFSLWADSPVCDADRVDDFYSLQQLAYLGSLMNGDSFAVLQTKKRPGCPYDLRVRLVEAGRICRPGYASSLKLEIVALAIIKDGVIHQPPDLVLHSPDAQPRPVGHLSQLPPLLRGEADESLVLVLNVKQEAEGVVRHAVVVLLGHGLQVDKPLNSPKELGHDAELDQVGLAQVAGIGLYGLGGRAEADTAASIFLRHGVGFVAERAAQHETGYCPKEDGRAMVSPKSGNL